MSDFSNYEKQGLHPGRTVAYDVTELRNPDGTYPVVHLENIGIANESLRQSMIAQAGSPTEQDERELLVKHGVRKLERVYFSDGKEATDTDIPAFVRALPFAAMRRMFLFACSDANYCEYPIATPPEILAEK